jgi:hypothetical protein
MKLGRFTVTNITSSVPTDAIPRTHVKTVMRGKGDPGYLGSAGSCFHYLFISCSSTILFHPAKVMISESALALVCSHDKLPNLARKGGVLTPMSALGDVLIERLQSTGRFEFTSEIVVPSHGKAGKKTD